MSSSTPSTTVVGVDDPVDDRVERRARPEREQLGLPLQVLADLAEAAGFAVPHRDHEVGADEDHHLADVDELLGAEVAHGLDHEEERVAVDLQPRPLVRADGVLDRELVEVELAPDRVELLHRRLDQPDPGEAAGVGRLGADARDLPGPFEPVPSP